MEDFQRIVNATQGYMELGMFAEALGELDLLEAAAQQRPEILELRALILMQLRRWEEALAVSRKICEVAPESGAGFVHAAFCLHELGHTAEAKQALTTGPPTIRSEPVFHYNLACYECQLGNLEAAREHLQRSFEMDRKYRESAASDPDLAPLRESPSGNGYK